MQVLVDARKIADGGIGTYIRNLVSGLIEQPGVELGVLTRSDANLPAGWRERIAIHVDDTRPYSLSEMFLFPDREVLSSYDLMHIPHYTLPFLLPKPAVITVHDLIHVTHPESWMHSLLAPQLIRSALSRAARVLTVSKASERALCEFVGDKEAIRSKIRVVPNAIDPALLERRASPYVAGAPYILSVCSTAKPHKGTTELLEAFDLLKRDRRVEGVAELKLIVVGRGATRERQQQLGVLEQSDIEFMGEVSSESLAALYDGARALVVPSRVEGFCLPVLEAQARRIPVVTTPIPAVEDLVTSRDTIAEDFTAIALARAIGSCLVSGTDSKNPASEDEYQRHLSRFDRRLLAAEVLSVYQEILNEAAEGSAEGVRS